MLDVARLGYVLMIFSCHTLVEDEAFDKARLVVATAKPNVFRRCLLWPIFRWCFLDGGSDWCWTSALMTVCTPLLPSTLLAFMGQGFEFRPHLASIGCDACTAIAVH